MGSLVGNEQNTSAVQSNINFEPIFQFGQGLNNTDITDYFQDFEQKPRQDNSLTASAVVPIDSTTGANTASTSRQQKEGFLVGVDSKISNKNILIFGAVVGVGALFFYMQKDKK